MQLSSIILGVVPELLFRKDENGKNRKIDNITSINFISMDEIDFGICMMLVQNSRIPYRELAELFNMSVNSIHKRINNLSEYPYHPVNPVHTIMYGYSQIENKAGLLQELGSHECIFNVTQASDHLFYIHALLRNHNELDPLVSFVRKKAEINDIEIGLVSLAPSPNVPHAKDSNQIYNQNNSAELRQKPLSKLDFLIVNALKDNSRKPISDIADEVGASTKTVRRHLDKMIKDKPEILFKSFIFIVIIKLKSSTNVDKVNLLDEIRKKHGQIILFSWNLSNLPNQLLVCVWAHSMKELQTLEASLMAMAFDSVNITILVKGLMFPTWRDKYLEDKLREIKDGLK